MHKLAMVVLTLAMVSAGPDKDPSDNPHVFVAAASAQTYPNTATLTPFSREMNFMSEAGYARYLNHQRMGDEQIGNSPVYQDDIPYVVARTVDTIHA